MVADSHATRFIELTTKICRRAILQGRDMPDVPNIPDVPSSITQSAFNSSGVTGTQSAFNSSGITQSASNSC
jgi:hypothetical protein